MDPPPTPTANPASSSVTTRLSAPNSSFASTGNSARNVAPMVQNQDRPRMHSHTARLARAVRSRAYVSVTTFQPIRSPGDAGRAAGTANAAAAPATATSSPAPATQAGPSARPISTPPAMVPARMPPNVPASTSALPRTSSRVASKSGSSPYLSGLKNAACVPSPNRTAIKAGTLPARNPQPASSINATSASLFSRSTRALSYRSANCPASDENSM